MKVIKICISEWNLENRDKRELSVYRDDFGWEVSVIAKGGNDRDLKADTVDGFEVRRYSTRPLGTKSFFAGLNRVLSLFVWAHRIRKEKADILSCHDLGALLIGWMSNIFTFQKKKLIYDSHEFELGRNANRNKLTIWLIKFMEGALLKKCLFSIMVNDSIADEVTKIYGLDERPVVVRSTPDYWSLNQAEIAKTRKFICDELGISHDTFILMYHGGIMPGRNIESLIDAVSGNSETAGIILGNALSESYKDELMEYAETLGVRGRIYFHAAVDGKELYKYVGAANVGMMVFSAKNKSYYYSLPNKFFENIQALTPILTSNFPEMSRIVEQYKIGLTVTPDDKGMIDGAVDKLKNNKEFYDECKRNLCVAKENLCWENEKKVLINACNKYL